MRAIKTSDLPCPAYTVMVVVDLVRLFVIPQRAEGHIAPPVILRQHCTEESQRLHCQRSTFRAGCRFRAQLMFQWYSFGLATCFVAPVLELCIASVVCTVLQYTEFVSIAVMMPAVACDVLKPFLSGTLAGCSRSNILNAGKLKALPCHLRDFWCLQLEQKIIAEGSGATEAQGISCHD